MPNNHKPSYFLIAPPVLLVVVGFVIYFLVVKFTTPKVQTLTVEPSGQTASPSAVISPTASTSATPQASSSAR